MHICHPERFQSGAARKDLQNTNSLVTVEKFVKKINTGSRKELESTSRFSKVSRSKYEHLDIISKAQLLTLHTSSCL